MTDNTDGFKEYQEGNKIAMAYLQMTWMAGSIFVSASFAIFGLSFNVANPNFRDLFLMGFSSMLLYGMFLIYDWRYTKVTKIIFKKLQKFEVTQKMNMKFHTSIDQADKRAKKTCGIWFKASRLYFWSRLGFVVLLILWIVRIFSILLT